MLLLSSLLLFPFLRRGWPDARPPHTLWAGIPSACRSRTLLAYLTTAVVFFFAGVTASTRLTLHPRGFALWRERRFRGRWSSRHNTRGNRVPLPSSPLTMV
ncbi:unnamed protein product [Ectocarpus sp. 12 AP-2014]